MANISKWADTRAGNALGSTPDYPPEGMDKSDVNDVMRENMAAARVWYQDPTFINIFESNDETWTFSKTSDTVVRVTGPVDPSTILNTGRRIRIEPGPVVGYVVSVAAAAPNFDITVLLDAAAVVPTNPTKVELGCVGGGNGMFLNTGTSGTTLMIAEDLQATMTAILAADSAANKEFGTDTDQLPQNSDLGSASLATVGTGPTELPTNADLPTFGDLATLNKGRSNLYELANDFTAPDGSLNAITGLDGLVFPGTPNGSLVYRVTINIYMKISVAAPDNFDGLQVLMGTAGDETDDKKQVLLGGFHLATNDDYSGATNAESCGSHACLFMKPATDQLLTIAFEAESGDMVLNAGGPQMASTVYIELLDDLWAV